MESNVGSTDRIVRLILGLVIIGLGIAYSSWWGLIGVVALATAAISWCPAYRLIGMSTRGKS